MSDALTPFLQFAPQVRPGPDWSELRLGELGYSGLEEKSVRLDLSADEQRVFAGLQQGMARADYHSALNQLPPARRMETAALVEGLGRQGHLFEQLRAGQRLLASRQLVSPWFRPAPVDPASAYALSGFALLRRQGDGILLESPLCHARILFTVEGHATAAGLLAGGVEPGWDADAPSAALIRMLVDSGFMIRRLADGSTIEDQQPALRDWAFHDLLFHARSRTGRHRYPYGKVEPGESGFADQYAEPINDLQWAGEPIVLPQPDLARLAQEELPFTQVLENRRSRRMAQPTPLTLDMVAEFLFRTARIKQRDAPAPVGPWRPFASAAGVGEIDVFLSVFACEGLDAGLYRYDAENHLLQRIVVSRESLAQLESFSGMEPLGVHFLITARFGKLNTRYNSIAYSLVLRNVGCLLQTMYLVATAMDRAPCAIGAGDADVFARITGLPYEVQGTVGDFVLR